MGPEKIMWGLNTLLLAVLAFFIRMWMLDIKDSLKDIRRDLEGKQDAGVCDMHHREISRSLHIHGTLGQAGEVINR